MCAPWRPSGQRSSSWTALKVHGWGRSALINDSSMAHSRLKSVGRSVLRGSSTPRGREAFSPAGGSLVYSTRMAGTLRVGMFWGLSNFSFACLYAITLWFGGHFIIARRPERLAEAFDAVG